MSWRDNNQGNGNYNQQSRGGYSGGGGGNDGYSDFGDLGKKDFTGYPKIKKDFYIETDETKKLTEKEVKDFRDKNEINVFGKDIPKPYLTWTSTGFPDYILDQAKTLGFKTPTSIQSQSWPISLKGSDVIALAETGSGKTLGFLIPAIIHMRDQEKVKRGDGPISLVLAPTRELAIQIDKECLKFCSQMGIRTCCVYGGSNRQKQISELRSGVDIVIATPGRLLDLLSCKVTNLDRVSYLILDEADRMLDMGFEPQIRKLINVIRPDRQTLMFSATWSKEVQSLAVDFLNNPVIINVGSVDVSANHKVLQKFLFIQNYDKMDRLLSIIDSVMDGRKILIFTQTKRKADEVCSLLRNSGWPSLAIHGDKSQMERDWVMSEFRSGNSPIMVATDVAARGLDIKDIKLVINFDLPNDIESYVHRIGRTARAKNTGSAISFFAPGDIGVALKLKNILEEAKQIVPPQIQKLCSLLKGGSRGGSRGGYSGGNSYGGDNYKKRRY